MWKFYRSQTVSASTKYPTHLVRIFEARPSELNLKRDKLRKVQGETTWLKGHNNLGVCI